MPVIVNGIPRDTGATDLEDSARLAGMLAVADMRPLPLPGMYLNKQGELARHKDSELSFTRDQLIPLAYYHASIPNYVDMQAYYQMEYKLIKACNSFTAPNGKDFLAPHHKAYLKKSVYQSEFEPSSLAKACLIAEIYWHAFYQRGLSEPNQLICMLLTFGDEYVRMWKSVNKNWEESINMYWCGWRNEPELAKKLINIIGAI